MKIDIINDVFRLECLSVMFKIIELNPLDFLLSEDQSPRTADPQRRAYRTSTWVGENYRQGGIFLMMKAAIR